jgi:hypothetical protein
MASRRLFYCLAAAGGLAGAVQAGAQAPLARLTVGAGSATDLRGVRSGAWVLAPQVTLFPDPGVTLGLGGRATRFSNEVWSAGGSGALNARIPLGSRLGVLFGASGDATWASYHATYLQADATPALELRQGSLSLWAGARAAAARTTSSLTGVPSVFGQPRDTTSERSTLGPAFGLGLDLASFAPGEGVRLTYREEHLRPGGIAETDRTAAVTLARGPVVLTGSLGARQSQGGTEALGGGQLAVTVARGIAVFAAAESYPANRLTGTPGGRSFSGGLSLSTGGLGAPRALPRPAGAPPPPAGLTRVSIAAADARRVEVAGDWNQWRPVPLQRADNGVWYLDLAIAPGVYRYAFRIDGQTWQVPRGVAAVDDGFGGKSAWLTVGQPGHASTQSAN